MKGIEKQVLRLVKELKDADSEAIARWIGVSGEYVDGICRSLVKDRYLEESINGSYGLTPRGAKAISPVRAKGPIPILKGGG